jgi:hypothetical protein
MRGLFGLSLKIARTIEKEKRTSEKNSRTKISGKRTLSKLHDKFSLSYAKINVALLLTTWQNLPPLS